MNRSRLVFLTALFSSLPLLNLPAQAQQGFTLEGLPHTSALFPFDAFGPRLTRAVSQATSPGRGGSQLTALDPKGTLYLLAVGVKDFDDSAIPGLEYTEADAAALTRAFQAQKGRVFTNVKATTLLGRDATRQNIEAAMNAIANQVTPQDTVVAYFSTHGQKGSGDEYYIITRDTDVGAYGATALLGSTVLEFYRKVQANTLLLLDTCYSGALAGNKAGVSSDTNALLDKSVGTRATNDRFEKTVVASATGGQKAWECKAQGQGCFTAALLEALDGKGGQGTQGVTVNKVLSYLAERVPELVRAEEGSDPQKPSTASPLGVIATWTLARPNLPTPIRPPEPPKVEQPTAQTGVFVSSGGQDSNTGAASVPFLSLERALKTPLGNRVTFSSGEYRLPKGGLTLSQPLTLAGQGVTLNCEPGSKGLTITGDITLEGLRVVGCTIAVSVQGGTATLKDLSFQGNGKALEVVGTARAYLTNSRFLGNGLNKASTVRTESNATLEVRDSSFENSEQYAISGVGNSTVRIINSTFINNGYRSDDAIRHTGFAASANVRIENSRFQGGEYSVVAFPIAGYTEEFQIRLCGGSDQTQDKTYKVGGC